jgi:hypothetical protein
VTRPLLPEAATAKRSLPGPGRRGELAAELLGVLQVRGDGRAHVDEQLAKLAFSSSGLQINGLAVF